jgi:hypothetical protein
MTPDIENILDDCIEGIRAGKPMEDVLKAYPDAAPELRSLLRLARQLGDLPAPEPTVGGLMRAMAHNATVERPKKGRTGRFLLFRAPVLARIAAAIVVVSLVGWGTTAASAGAVPGDLLYGLKRFTERVKFFLTLNAENQAELRIVFSEERMAEALRKHTRGEGLDDDLLAAMLEEARLAMTEAGDLPPVERRRVVARAAAATSYQKQVLADMRNRASEGERQRINTWMDRCQDRWQWMCSMPGQPQPAQGNRQQTQPARGNRDQDQPATGNREPTPQGWRDNCMQNCPMW